GTVPCVLLFARARPVADLLHARAPSLADGGVALRLRLVTAEIGRPLYRRAARGNGGLHRVQHLDRGVLILVVQAHRIVDLTGDVDRRGELRRESREIRGIAVTRGLSLVVLGVTGIEHGEAPL